jgi:16S rRNA G966 N2-methylase RsmD
MEYDRKAFDLLRENVGAVDVGERGFCWRVDVCKTSFKPKGLPDHLPYSLIFFDPPYPIATDLTDSHPLGASLKRLAKDGVTHSEAVMVLRTPNEHPLTLPTTWVEVDRLRISSSRISLCRKPEPVAAKSPEDD